MMDEESGRVVQAVSGKIYIADYSLYIDDGHFMTTPRVTLLQSQSRAA
jgi:hypothetical protein